MYVGQAFTRREPKNDPFDDVVVRGIIDSGYGWSEVAISPVTFGEVIAADPNSLIENYKPADGSNATAELEAEVARWETRLEELEAGT